MMIRVLTPIPTRPRRILSDVWAYWAIYDAADKAQSKGCTAPDTDQDCWCPWHRDVREMIEAAVQRGEDGP